MNNTVSSLTEYKNLLSKLKAHEQFSKRRTINRQKVKVSDFLTSKNGYEYFRKIEVNIEYFSKLKEKEGVLIILDKSQNLGINVFINITKDTFSKTFKDENQIK